MKLGYDYEIPMLEARFVTTEQGTGIVHCAPSHGPDDFNLCLNNGIKQLKLLMEMENIQKMFCCLRDYIFLKQIQLVIEKLKEQKKLII